MAKWGGEDGDDEGSVDLELEVDGEDTGSRRRRRCDIREKGGMRDRGYRSDRERGIERREREPKVKRRKVEIKEGVWAEVEIEDDDDDGDVTSPTDVSDAGDGEDEMVREREESEDVELIDFDVSVMQRQVMTPAVSRVGAAGAGRKKRVSMEMDAVAGGEIREIGYGAGDGGEGMVEGEGYESQYRRRRSGW